jgi:hypothetical protein
MKSKNPSDQTTLRGEGRFSSLISKEAVIVIVFLLTSALAVSYDYYKKVDSLRLAPRLELHERIIQGTAPSPYQYRVLVPFTTEIIRQLFLAGGMNANDAFRFSYALYNFLAVFFSLFASYIYFRCWFRYEHALIGCLFIAVIMPVNFRYHTFQPWSLIEIGFFAFGLYAIYTEKWEALALTILFASLNRETAIFIPFILGVHFIREGLKKKALFSRNTRYLVMILGFAGIWLMVFFGLRLIFGNAPHVSDLADLFERNLQPLNLYRTSVALILFFGFYWFLILFGYLKAPDFVKVTIWIVPFYLVTYLVWGVWYETRVLMSLYPIFIPLGLSLAFPHKT